MSDLEESVSFTLPIASSSPKSSTSFISSLEEKLEREIADRRRKTEEMKLKIIRESQLMLANLKDGIHYIITSEENHQSCGSILKKTERNAKKGKSTLNKNSAQRVRFDLDKENCQPTGLKRIQPERNVKRSNALSKTSIQSGSTSSGKTSSKSSALKEEDCKHCSVTRNMIPLKSSNYKIASVTPKPNIKSSPAILRQPKPGEVVISMNGSPLLVSTIQGSRHIPQIIIPIDEEKILTVLGEESLDANDFPGVDLVTKARLANLHNFLGQVLENEK